MPWIKTTPAPPPTETRIKELKVTHVYLRDNFELFTRYFFKAQYKQKFKRWPHLLRIMEKLQAVVDGDITRLIINVAPRYGKTEVAVKSFIPYGLALNAAAKFIHLSYSDSLALDNSEAARDLVESAEYQELFPSVRIKPGTDSKKKWYTTAGGGVYATSSGGQITGFGAGRVDPDAEELKKMQDEFDDAVRDLELQAMGISWLGNKSLFAGAIIIDDPNKVDDADSELLRRRVNERYDSTISNRVNSRRTPIIILQQRTHENDLSGYLIEKQGTKDKGGVWDVLSLPSIQEDGTALCPDKHTIEELKALEAHNDIVFQRQHMQNPKPKSGLLFPIDELHFYDPEDVQLSKQLEDPDFIYVPCDPANEGGDDFAAAPFKLIGNKIYVTSMLYNTLGADHNELALEEMIVSEKAMFAGVEAVLGWAETARRVRNALIEREWPGQLRMLRPRTHKHTRIVNRSAFIRNNMYFRSDWKNYPQYAKFIRNLTTYLKIQEPGAQNKHDDAPDLCEMAGVYYERNFPQLWALPAKDKIKAADEMESEVSDE